MNEGTKMSKFGVILTIAMVLGFADHGSATLWDRGSGMIYDDYFNITWLKDANYSKTSGYNLDGLMNWQASLDWVGQLEYMGYRDWCLPHIDHYFYLHQNFEYIEGVLYASPFSNVQTSSYYWTSEEYHPGDETIPPIYSWAYSFDLGGGYTEMPKLGESFAWAIRNGDVAPVAEPSTMLLVIPGLVAFGGIRLFAGRRFRWQKTCGICTKPQSISSM